MGGFNSISKYRLIYLVALFGIWSTLLGLVVKGNYFDPSGASKIVSLDTGFKDLPDDSEWMNIYLKGKKLGYSVSSLRNLGESGYGLTNDVQMKTSFAGIPTELSLHNKVMVDTLFRLQAFDFRIISGNYSTRVEGLKLNGKLQLSTGTGNSQSTREIDAPTELYTALSIQPLVSSRGLKKGDRFSLSTFDPISLKIGLVELSYEGKQEVMIAGVPQRLNKIKALYQGIPAIIWLDDNGVRYKEETIMGLVMERTTPSASHLTDFELSSFDFIDHYSIPVEGRILDQGSLSELKVELEGIKPNDLNKLAAGRQRLLQEDPLILRLRTTPTYSVETNLTKFLTSTDMIQAQHPTIILLAQRFVNATESGLELVGQLNEWVYNYLDKRPVVGLTSAVDILQQKQGDCSEHTVLFTALSRAAGIPTKVHIGIVHLDGKFLYHAWPVVYLKGQWIAVDPTLGQSVADATHIAFFESDFANLTNLITFIGNLKIKIIDQEYQEPRG